jgi:SIR2-like domain
MPVKLSKLQDRLLDAAKHRNLIPIVGSGLSRQAGDAFPGWIELLEKMKVIDRQELLMAAEALRQRMPPDEYQAFLAQQFHPSNVKPAKVHKALFRLPPPLLLTTNYDHLLEDAYAEVYMRNAEVYRYLRADTIQQFLQSGQYTYGREGPIIFKMHGSIEESSNIILSARDYRHILYWQQGYRLVLSAIFLTKVVLMLGFSFADPELRVLPEFLRDSLRDRISLTLFSYQRNLWARSKSVECGMTLV